jgi:hypothetical protein
MARTWSDEAGALRGGSAIRLSSWATSRLDGADRPVVPVRANLGVDPVHVLFPGLFLLLAVPLDVLGGQLLEQHDRRTVPSSGGPASVRPSGLSPTI